MVGDGVFFSARCAGEEGVVKNQILQRNPRLYRKPKVHTSAAPLTFQLLYSLSMERHNSLEECDCLGAVGDIHWGGFESASKLMLSVAPPPCWVVAVSNLD